MLLRHAPSIHNVPLSHESSLQLQPGHMLRLMHAHAQAQTLSSGHGSADPRRGVIEPNERAYLCTPHRTIQVHIAVSGGQATWEWPTGRLRSGCCSDARADVAGAG